MSNCIFCDIIAKKLPAYLVAENQYAIAFLPKKNGKFRTHFDRSKKALRISFWYSSKRIKKPDFLFAKYCEIL